MTTTGRAGEGRARPYVQTLLRTERGTLQARLYEAPGSEAGVVMAGGAGGGFDTPAAGLYPRLGEELSREGITALHLQYRNPTELEQAVFDVLACVAFLEGRGVRRVALVGHSFGGAVMIAAGVLAPRVVTVVGLSSQSFGVGGVDQLAPRSLLLLHGTADTVLPPSASIFIHDRARGPRSLELLEGAGHVLDEAAPRVHARVRDWLLEALSAPAAHGPGGTPAPG